MNGKGILERIVDGGIVAVVRADSADSAALAAEAIAQGGIPAIEIAFTVPDAAEVIRGLSRTLPPSVILGAGTVLDAETARSALSAGARFIVSPALDLEVVRFSRLQGAPVFPGAMTPSEVLAAWQAGGDLVKIFPADVGGPNYLKSLHGPFPQIRLMPTGGVDLETAESFLRAGASCLGVGSALVDSKSLKNRDFGRLTDLAARYVALVRRVRESMSAESRM